MAPCFRPGHYVLFDCAEPANVGDAVVVVFRDGAVQVRRLAACSRHGYTLHAYQPASDALVPHDQVREIHPIFACRKAKDIGAVLLPAAAERVRAMQGEGRHA
ncbi:hypothetical protein A9P79_25690 [Cupriavidus taiwanensis]|nr:hypothetical protein A9P79_25690 [Cupriavidus taiwanensis]